MTDLAGKLRHEAGIVPHEHYHWLNPLLIDAAAEIERLRAQRNEKAQEIVGWKRTALAMRDQAIYWLRDGQGRYDEIERLYFDAAMFSKFAPGNAFAVEQKSDDRDHLGEDGDQSGTRFAKPPRG